MTFDIKATCPISSKPVFKKISMKQLICGKDYHMSDVAAFSGDDDLEQWELLDAFRVMSLAQQEFQRVDKAARSYKTHPVLTLDQSDKCGLSLVNLGSTEQVNTIDKSRDLQIPQNISEVSTHQSHHQPCHGGKFPASSVKHELLEGSTCGCSKPPLPNLKQEPTPGGSSDSSSQYSLGSDRQLTACGKTFTLVDTDDSQAYARCQMSIAATEPVHQAQGSIKAGIVEEDHRDEEEEEAECSSSNNRVCFSQDCYQWVTENLCSQPSISLHRSRLYEEWCSHSRIHKLSYLSQSAFGRVVRHAFPDVKTRRLGSRGDSRYYYYGIGVKSSSPLHTLLLPFHRGNSNVYGGSGRTFTIEHTDQMIGSSTRFAGKLRLALPAVTENNSSQSAVATSLPLLDELHLPQDQIPVAEVFLLMYKVHCQRLTDLILCSSARQVEVTIVTFWSHLPVRLEVSLASSRYLQELAVWCDLRLLAALQTRLQLEPGSGPRDPDRLPSLSDLRGMSHSLPQWVWRSMYKFPPHFQQTRRLVYATWSSWLKRACSVCEVGGSVTSLLHDADMVDSASKAWVKLDINAITEELKVPHSVPLAACLLRFGSLLCQQVSLPSLLHWLRAVLVSSALDNMNQEKEESLQTIEQVVMLHWNQLTCIVSRELTLNAPESFALFHLLILLLTDFISNLFVEWTLHIRDRQCQQSLLKQHHQGKSESNNTYTANTQLRELLQFVQKEDPSKYNSPGKEYTNTLADYCLQ